jgi:hypothetical protein
MSLVKLLCDPNALKWLAEHPEFGGVDNYRAGTRAFCRSGNPEVALFAEKLESVRDRLTDEQRQVADWFVTMAPRDVAKHFGVPVKQVYRQYVVLRQAVDTHYTAMRADKRGARAGRAELETLPEFCALASRHFTYHGREETVYLVQQLAGPVWVDRAGAIFQDEIQDLLDELHEHAAGFEVVEAE